MTVLICLVFPVATITTGIDGVITEPVVDKHADNRIYSIDGRCVGTDAGALKEGIYIMNGKKFMR